MTGSNGKILAALLLVLAAPVLSGCIAVAAGAGGGAGYYLSKQEDRSQPQVTEDDTITAQVQGRFAADPDLSAQKIHIDTYDGIVSLTGDVPNGAIAQRAIDSAHAVPGVKGVRSELTVH